MKENFEDMIIERMLEEYEQLVENAEEGNPAKPINGIY